MLSTTLTTSALASAACLVGLLIFGTRWRRTGFLRCLGYALALVGLAAAAALLLLEAGAVELTAGGGLVLTSILATYIARRDWNPPAQAVLGSLALTCGLFVVYAARFAFSQDLPPLGYVANIALIALEVLALSLLLVATHETLDTAGRVRWHRRKGKRGGRLRTVCLGSRPHPQRAARACHRHADRTDLVGLSGIRGDRP